MPLIDFFTQENFILQLRTVDLEEMKKIYKKVKENEGILFFIFFPTTLHGI
jgi:hypothetical protein